MSLRPHLLDFVRGERGGVDRGTVCVELEMLGKCTPEMWAKADAKQWSKEIDSAIKAGDLLEEGKTLRIPPPAEAKPKEVQLSLFGE